MRANLLARATEKYREYHVGQTGCALGNRGPSSIQPAQVENKSLAPDIE